MSETNHIKGGATIWARQTIDIDIFRIKNSDWFKIWFYIVNKVNHEDNQWFPRGSNFFQYREIELAVRVTKDQVKHCIDYLKRATMIATRKATRGMIITVLKYDFYQNLDNYKATQKAMNHATKKPHESHTINKNVKNDNTNSETKVSQSSPPVPNGLVPTTVAKYDHTEDLAPDGDRKDPADDPANIPFDCEVFMNSMKNSRNHAQKTVVLYWKKKGRVPQNLKQAKQEMGKDLKYAKGLSGYSGEQILNAINNTAEHAEKLKYDWSLKTVSDRISRIVNVEK